MKENITTIYLIRHSTKFNPNMIDIYNSTDNEQLKTKKDANLLMDWCKLLDIQKRQ